MVRFALEAASDAAAARIPELIAQWMKQHPARLRGELRARLAARLGRGERD